MKRMKRVLSGAKLRTSATSSNLNVEAATGSVAVGRRPDARPAAFGFVGKVNEHSGASSVLDYSVWMDLEYPHVVGVFGSRGTGKSFALGVIVECISGLSEVNSGDPPDHAVLILDVQNQFWTLAFEPNGDLEEDVSHLRNLRNWGLEPCKIPNLRIWSPAGYPIPEESFAEFKLSPEQLSEEDWLTTLELERFSPMGQALLQLLDHRPQALPYELQALSVQGSILRGFQDSTIEGLRWRLAGLSDTEIIGRPGVSIEHLCSKGSVSVLLLRELPDSLRQLVVGVISRLISRKFGKYQQDVRLSRRFHRTAPPDDLPQRVWLIVDEAHLLVPSGPDTAATAPVIDFVKRGRDAGLSLVFATQQPSAVDSRLMSQVDLTLTHSLGFEVDISAAIQRMPTRTSVAYQISGLDLPSLGDAIRSLDPGECIVADGASGRAFAMRVRPRVTAHGGNHPI